MFQKYYKPPLKTLLLKGGLVAEKRKKDSDDISIDLNRLKESAKKFFAALYSLKDSKYFTSTTIAILLILALMATSIVIRSQQYTLPITDVWAEQTIRGNIIPQIEQQIRAENPGLTDTRVRELAQQQYNAYYQANKAELDAQKKSMGEQFRRQLQDENGNTYQTGIDPWLFYSDTKWYLRNGFFGTEIVDGEQKFMLRNGRIGITYGFQWISYIGALTHYAFNLFGDYDLMFTGFFYQTILVTLTIIFAFLLGRKLGGNNTAGFFAGALFAFMPAIFSRTMETFDTDWVTFLFPIATIWALLEALDAKTLRSRIIYGAASGISLGFFTVTWGGWWYTFNLVILTIIMFFAYKYITAKYLHKEKKASIIGSATPALVVLGVFLGGLILFTFFNYGLVDRNVSVGEGLLRLTSAPEQTFRFVQEFTGGAVTGAGEQYPLWPNVFRTVAELRRSSVGDAIQGIGGILVFLLVVAGIASLVLRYKESDMYPFYALVLAAWLAIMAYSVTTGIRFHAFFAYVSAFCIAALLGTLAGPVVKKIGGWFENESLGKGIMYIIIFGGAFLLLVVPSIQASNTIVRNSVPNFDDDWVAAMHIIRDSSERAIITSWWDFGHFFQAVAERSVTFDGGDQGQRIYWVGKSLSTSDEGEAVDILRMLNCGQEESYRALLSITGNQIRATNLILEITRMSEAEARQRLQTEGFSVTDTERVLRHSHCDDLIDNYLIVSEDMVAKSGVWAHFGNWNFTRSYAYYGLGGVPLDQGVRMLMEETGLEEGAARDTLLAARRLASEREAEQWISPTPSYLMGRPASCTENDDAIGCDINVQVGSQGAIAIVLWRAIISKDNYEDTALILRGVDPLTGNVVGQQTTLRPNAVVVAEEDRLVRYDVPDSGTDLDVLLFENEFGQKRVMVSNPLLTESMFTRLFFLDGKYTDNFELVDDRTTFRGQRIITYKIDFG